MHPVDLDKLLDTVPQPYEPTKHDDSPFVWLEVFNNNEESSCLFMYHVWRIGVIYKPTNKSVITSDLEQVLYSEICMMRETIKIRGWKP